MKKIIVTTLAICFTLTLTACDNRLQEAVAPEEPTIAELPAEDVADEETPGDIQPEELHIQISLVSDEFLSGFDYLHEFDYWHVHEWIGDYDNHTGDRLVIWANAPMRDFAVMRAANDFIDDEFFYIPLSIYGHVDEVLPGQAYVIHRYVGMGTLPWSGITFVDEYDEQRYFMMLQDQSGLLKPWPFDPDILNLFEDGHLQIVSIDGRGERQYFTVTHDENGEFDPEIWLIENAHLLFSYMLIEFENRTHELPSDWEPWW